jgi:diguanylate cyclase (GGDEF)-like protein
MQFWYKYRSTSAGTIVTLSGFALWTSVFSIALLGPKFIPGFHVDEEVWNLPKYLVAVGMILLILEEQLRHNLHMALHDEMTGLPNRRLYLDHLAGAIERAQRGKLQMAILAVDLNGFKNVNDTMGHQMGDTVLQFVAARLSTRVRRADTLARTGGDEFSVILESPAGRTEAELLSEALKCLLKAPIQIGEHEIRVSASIGHAVYPDDAPDIRSLCVVADERMYQAKRSLNPEPDGRPGILFKLDLPAGR